MSVSVLLVDDDDANRITLSALLEDEGYAVDVAANFGEASRKLTQGAGYDLVLLDQHLGDGIGTELIPTIRARLPKAKVVLVSGSIEAGAAGLLDCDGVVRKGSNFPALVSLIRTFAQGSRHG
jgi:CheY-like chemotaxis protein